MGRRVPMSEWIKATDRLPADDKEVVAIIDYSNDLKFGHKALMYRRGGDWYFVGSNTQYHGKYITYWLDDGMEEEKQ